MELTFLELIFPNNSMNLFQEERRSRYPHFLGVTLWIKINSVYDCQAHIKPNNSLPKKQAGFS
jgi:hypothetical protein